MKTIAQQLNVTDFPFIINDKDGNRIYWEDSTGLWIKSEYDANGNRIRYETSHGYWEKSEYDANGNRIRYETSHGYWEKSEYDANSNEIYYKNSAGTVHDNRPKMVELTLQQIADALGIKVEQLRIKD
jgi:hypothetical protein